jgi:signal peptidase I
MTDTSPYKARAARFWKEWVKPLLVIGILLGSFRSAIADWNDIPSGSMIPTILEGDRVVVNRVAYDLKVPFTTWRLAQWADPARGDIVVLISPYDGIRLVKRVVGLPGDVVAVDEGCLSINGVKASYASVSEEIKRRAGLGGPGTEPLAYETVAGRRHLVVPGRSSFGPVVVPEGRYFLMGDHREDSFDSRYWGFADRRLILGRVTAVALSADIRHGWRPRWGRFFTPLS